MKKLPLLLAIFLLINSAPLDAQQQRSERRGKSRQIVASDPFQSGIPFATNGRLDELMLAALKKAGAKGEQIPPADRCGDEVFLRRVFLDLTGTLPTPKEIQNFLDDRSPSKRSKIIDELVARPEFVDYRTMKWCDVLRVKAEFPINLWPNGAMTYYRWIHDAVRTDMPYDQFVRTLLTADGSNFRDGPSNFYRAVVTKDADGLAEAVAQTFMDIQTNGWSEEKQRQMAVFFSRVGYKESAEWKEEIVFWTRKPLDASDVFTDVFFPDGTKGKVKSEQDPRNVFADWLVRLENELFNRCIVNRVWAWLFGYGLMRENDGTQNVERGLLVPVHPEVLDYLCQELVEAKYDLKHLYRLILNSATYQQSSIPKSKDPRAAELFAAYPIRRMEAEVLQDAFSRIFGVPVAYSSEVPEPFTYIPARYRTIMLPDASVTSSFLEMFGRPTRDSGLESDRNNDVTESQQLFLLNSTDVNEWVKRFLQKYRNMGRKPEEQRKMLGEIWLTILCRHPTETELRIVMAEFRDQPGPQKLQDLVWSLLNTKEFMCRH